MEKPMEDALAGKYMTTVKVGPKGQIVIPKEARDLYDITPGDSILLLADRGMGIALLKADYCRELFSRVFPPEEPA